MTLHISALSKIHDRSGFCCGEQALDDYLKKQAGQDARRKIASVFVAANMTAPEKVIGFYTLSAASVSLASLSDEEAARLPRYPDLPAIRMGRLAVTAECQNRHIGKMLLMDAFRRSCASEIAWYFFLVEAKNERVARFYIQFSFTPFLDKNLSLWLTRKRAEKMVALLPTPRKHS